MRKFFIYSVLFIFFFINYFLSVSSNFVNPPSLINSSSNSLEITWEKINGAVGYFVYYSETSGKNYQSYKDAFEDNKAILIGLKPNTTYYIVVTSLDEVGESPYSKEGVFNTKPLNKEQFILDKINVISGNELELVFNYPLDSSSGAVREFNISKNNEKLDIIKEMKLNKKEKNKLNLILNKILLDGEYKLTILYITDDKGNNIEYGINGEINFIVPKEFTTNTKTIENNSDKENTDTIAPELNSAQIKGDNYGLAGKSITGVSSDIKSVSIETKELPKTGPEHILLVLISIILGFIYILFLEKKFRNFLYNNNFFFFKF